MSRSDILGLFDKNFNQFCWRIYHLPLSVCSFQKQEKILLSYVCLNSFFLFRYMTSRRHGCMSVEWERLWDNMKCSIKAIPFASCSLWKKIMSPLQYDSLYHVKSELLPTVISRNPWQVKLIGGSSQKNNILKVESQTIPTRKTSLQDKSFWLFRKYLKHKSKN